MGILSYLIITYVFLMSILNYKSSHVYPANIGIQCRRVTNVWFLECIIGLGTLISQISIYVHNTYIV